MDVKRILLWLTLLVFSAQAGEIAFKGSSVQFDYMEYDDRGEYIDSEKAAIGEMNGFDVALRFGGRARSGMKFIHDLEYSYYAGNTDYVGSPLYDPVGKYGDLKSRTQNSISELTYLVGLSLPVTRHFSIGGQTGFGNRQWKRGLGAGILETYTWSHWIAGGRADWLFKNGEFCVYANYQEAFLPKMSATNLGLVFDLGKTSGYKLGVRWSRKISQRLAFELEYVYDYWEIGKSGVEKSYDEKSYYEPSSETKNNYAKAGLVYLF